MTRTLIETRKADRAVMAEQVRALCEALGIPARVEVARFGDIEPRLITTLIEAPRGLRLNIDFDGDTSQPGVHVLSWHMDTDCDTCLSDAFGRINPHHFRKSTDVAYGMSDLLEVLRRRLAQVNDGSAFSETREAASIAKHGTAADRAARFAEWRATEEAKAAA